MTNDLQNFINYLVVTKHLNSAEKIIVLQKEIYSTRTIILKSNQLPPENIQKFILEKINTHYDELDKKHLLETYKEVELIPLYLHLHNLHNYLILKRNRLLYKECGPNLTNHILKNILFEIY
ncbi:MULTISPECIES: hypothetical protein [Cetobacterium]|uniref:Uncharacterized protein n=1 Tax=Candidatus Cetobacterium colombiensis TaxID=3073100 RepID=A0ABU4WB17_9FUSO|nr:hypothetical protein [Candidatus Cetobacterium colombiensis]MDX8335590.1 hypothetical protein [Candidatus Cetobacterium colombiensis]